MKPNKKVLSDARSVAGGLCRSNANGADRYGFTAAPDGKQVGYGEFLFPGENEDRVDWILELNSNEVRRANIPE